MGVILDVVPEKGRDTNMICILKSKKGKIKTCVMIKNKLIEGYRELCTIKVI